MTNQEFKQAIQVAAEQFKQTAKGCVGVVSHNDTDGVTSAAIIAKALQQLEIEFHLFFITRTEDIAKLIEEKPYDTFLLLASRKTKPAKNIPIKEPREQIRIIRRSINKNERTEISN